MNDQRKTERRAACTPGHIGCENGSKLFCWVHDVSDHGAKLELIDATETPDRFRLLSEDALEGRWVETVWRDDVRLGVRFLEPGTAPA